MENQVKQVIRQKITDALAAAVPAHTRREVHLPGRNAPPNDLHGAAISHASRTTDESQTPCYSIALSQA